MKGASFLANGHLQNERGKVVEKGTWILASGSPRRQELLGQLGVNFLVQPSEIEENVNSNKPEEVVLELSSQKATAVAFQAPPYSLVLGADTMVAVNDKILGKPATHEEAYEMIASLQGFMPAAVITSGGPNNATLFYTYYMYKQAFEFSNMGYASVMSWMLFIIMMIPSVFLIRKRILEVEDM